MAHLLIARTYMLARKGIQPASQFELAKQNEWYRNWHR